LQAAARKVNEGGQGRVVSTLGRAGSCSRCSGIGTGCEACSRRVPSPARQGRNARSDSSCPQSVSSTPD